MKFCKDCKHYEAAWDELDSHCNRDFGKSTSKISLVTGKVIIKRAKYNALTQRMLSSIGSSALCGSDFCGKEAIYFEQKERGINLLDKLKRLWHNLFTG